MREMRARLPPERPKRDLRRSRRPRHCRHHRFKERQAHSRADAFQHRSPRYVFLSNKHRVPFVPLVVPSLLLHRRHSHLKWRTPDDPDGCAEVSEDVAALLEEWECPTDCTEEELTQALADYLDEETEWEVETWPRTQHGTPDILVGDLLALELKVDPNKAERDRCVGQCSGYSRQWMKWIVLFDASASRVGAIQDLLKDKGLDHISVWSF